MIGVAGIGRARSRMLPALLVAALAMAAALIAPPADTRAEDPPLPIEPNTIGPILPPRPCAFEGNDPYERRIYQLDGWRAPRYVRYPGVCERLRFAYGPLLVKPGQNDVLVEPITIQKPLREGYMTRFEPNLVLPDGTVPPVEEVHLHHGTWLSIPEYGGTLPFMAAGEEKTIATTPPGYGMPIKPTDIWALLYMVHSAVPNPMVAYITYDVDFIPQAKARKIGLKPVYPFWLDVRPSGYPVFNVQRKYGGRDGKCTWPRERCADFNAWGRREVGQGMPGNGRGTIFRFPERGGSMGRMSNFQGGTLIAMGGHLHPGGLYDDVELVRNGRKVNILRSDAVYWDHDRPNRPGGPPTSWDMSMTTASLPYWGVHVRPGDSIRINATYDTTHQATYENMGIVIGGIVPAQPNGKPNAPGLNPFRARSDWRPNCWRRTGGLQARPPVLCKRAIVTHGHQAANSNHSGPSGKWTARPGAATSQVNIAAFQYLPGDLSTINTSGVPTVKLGSKLRFTNVEGAAIYHTITTCKFPCLGTTGAAFPIGDGRTSRGRRLDLDSGTLGFGTPEIGPAKQTLEWTIPVTEQAGYRPGETVTYFCRIHPFMRGAFRVTE